MLKFNINFRHRPPRNNRQWGNVITFNIRISRSGPVSRRVLYAKCFVSFFLLNFYSKRNWHTTICLGVNNMLWLLVSPIVILWDARVDQIYFFSLVCPSVRPSGRVWDHLKRQNTNRDHKKSCFIILRALMMWIIIKVLLPVIQMLNLLAI